jgi:hypothetical protein
MQFLKWVPVLLITAALLIWGYFLVHSQTVEIATPLPIGNSFNGNEQIPVAEFKSKYNEGTALLSNLKTNIHTFRLLSTTSEWVSFILTSIISILLGIQGKLFQPDKPITGATKLLENPGDKYKQTNRRLMVIASLCSILIAFNSICKSKTETDLKNAQDLSEVLYKSRAGWFNAKTPAEATTVLQELDKFLINDQ